MGAVVTYTIYLVISVGLTVGTGLALARSGRVFLRDVFGGGDRDGGATAVPGKRV